MKTIFNIKSMVGIMVMCFATISVSAIPITELDYFSFESDQELYDTITELDNIYFTAYNNCDMEKQEELYAEDLEFYHDKGGLSTSKQEFLKVLRRISVEKLPANWSKVVSRFMKYRALELYKSACIDFTIVKNLMQYQRPVNLSRYGGMIMTIGKSRGSSAFTEKQ